jgi:hypothetical protein
VIGVVVLLLLQQLGRFALPDALTALIALVVAVGAGAIGFGLVGRALDRYR